MTTFAWTITHRKIEWPCRTEEDALGVLVFLRQWGPERLGPITVSPAPSERIAALLATMPGQQGALL